MTLCKPEGVRALLRSAWKYGQWFWIGFAWRRVQCCWRGHRMVLRTYPTFVAAECRHCSQRFAIDQP